MEETKEKIQDIKLSKKQIRKQKRLEKQQKHDFERYGIKPEDIKNKSTKTNWQALKQCFKYFTAYKLNLGLIIVLSLIFTACAIVFPIMTEKSIDALTQGQYKTAIIFMLIYLGISLLRWVVMYFWDLITVKTNNCVTKKIRSDLMQCVFDTKTKKYDTINSGEIISRINTDSSRISEIVFDFIDRAVGILTALAFIIYFFFLNIWLALGVMVVIIVFSSVDTVFQKYTQRLNKNLRHLNDKNVGIVTEIVRAIKDIKALNIKKNVNKKYDDNINNLFNVSNDKAKYGYLILNIAWALVAILDIALIILGIVFLSKELIALSVFIVFFMYRDRAIGIVRDFNFLRQQLKGASLSAERVCEILNEEDYPKEKFGKKRIKNPQGKIEFKNVDFGYDDKTKVLENFNLTIPANKTVAFVGKSGHGKSTLINLIPKLYDIQGGQVLIDGVDITKLSEDGLRDLVTIVPQSPYIFNTSIRENLSIVKPDMTDEEMIDVCKKAQIHDFIIKKEGGYDSIVGENGIILSGGQKQRIAIARALLKNSKIILLDEATSALDNESQAKVKEALDNLGGKHTIVIVAHRLSTVVDADKIIVIEKGKVVGEGTQKELLKTCDAFKKLYNIEKKQKK